MNRVVLALVGLLLAFFVWIGYRPEVAGLFPAPWDKFVHLLFFGLLAGPLYHGMGKRFPLVVMLLCTALGCWDEWRQLDLPGRSASLGDLVFDVLGALAGVLITGRIRVF